MANVHPEQGAGLSYGSTPVTYGFDAQYTVTQQAQPPPYPVPPNNTQVGPKPAWNYPPPPQYAPPMGAGSSYPMSTVPYPQPQPMQQQQQQQVVIIGGGTSRAPIRYTAVESFSGQIAISCLVFWFCNFVFGFIAFVLAAVANSIAVADSKRARHLGRASYILSGTGVIVTIVTIGIIVGVVVGGTSSAVSSSSSGGTGSSTCYYYYQNGVCYYNKFYVYTYSSCSSSYYSSYYYNYIDGYCYYNY